jgi:hypothetical protein
MKYKHDSFLISSIQKSKKRRLSALFKDFTKLINFKTEQQPAQQPF